jgi:hypothetical protein
MVLLGALSDEGLSLEDLRRGRQHRKNQSLIPLAMIHHCKQGYKNIAIAAALGKLEAYGPFLRMMADAHAILQPAKDEVARGGDRVPKPAIFVMAQPEPSPEEPDQAPAQPTAPGTLLGADGQEYVST